MKFVLAHGDFGLSLFLVLKFVGTELSSIGESSTSKSLSGELGDALLCSGDTDDEADARFDLSFSFGLLTEDSEPVS